MLSAGTEVIVQIYGIYESAVKWCKDVCEVFANICNIYLKHLWMVQDAVKIMYIHWGSIKLCYCPKWFLFVFTLWGVSRPKLTIGPVRVDWLNPPVYLEQWAAQAHCSSNDNIIAYVLKEDILYEYNFLERHGISSDTHSGDLVEGVG